MNLKEIRHENHMNEINEGSGYFIVLQFEARLLLENKTYHKNVISLQIIKRIGGNHIFNSVTHTSRQLHVQS